MAAPLSQDLPRRLVQAVEGGSSAREAARRVAVSESAAIKLIRRVRETGSAKPARIGGYRKPLLAGHEELSLGGEFSPEVGAENSSLCCACGS